MESPGVVEPAPFEEIFPLGAPPFGPIWEQPIPRVPLVFIDLELTGTSPERDAIIEVALLRERAGVLEDSLVSLVKTSLPSSESALRCHGISDEARASAPTIEELAPRIAALLEGAVPIGHGVTLDRLALGAALSRAGCAFSALQWMLDTDPLARRAINTRSYTLSALSQQLKLPERKWHRAHEDAEGVRALFHRLVPEFAARSAFELWQVRVGQREQVLVRSAIADTLSTMHATGAPGLLVLRSPGHSSTALHCRVEHWENPHVRLLLPNGTLRLLRADRILRIVRAPEVSRGKR